MSYTSFIIILFFMSVFVTFFISFLLSLFVENSSMKRMAVLLIALALIGTCAGFSGGMSRASAVGDIIPAFLGVIGGLSLYLFGIDTSKGLTASVGASALALSLFVSYALSSQVRNIGDDHRDIRTICATAYSNANLLSNDVAFARFEERLKNQCKGSLSWWVADNDVFWEKLKSIF